MTYDPLCELPPPVAADPNRRGRAPMGPDGRARLGYGQGDVASGGAAARLGLLDANRNGGTASMLSGSVGAGAWTDAAGRRNYGFNAEAGVARMGIAPGNGRMWGADVGLGTAQAGAYVNNSTMSLGAQANVLEGSATFAGRPWGDHDTSVRGGLSYGVGYGGRLHYGDEDNDGVRELGFGFDYGPVSFDLRSETLGHAYNWARRQLGGGGPQR